MKKINIKWQLVVYDIIIFLAISLPLLFIFRNDTGSSIPSIFTQLILSTICLFLMRFLGGIYQQIWRFGGVQCYLQLIFVDAAAFVINYVIGKIFLPEPLSFPQLLAVICVNLLADLVIRMIYRYAYKSGNSITKSGKFFNKLLCIFAGSEYESKLTEETQKIRIAIIGAGRVGVTLAEDLLNNAASSYIPRCFIDINKDKADRSIHGIPVYLEEEATFEILKANEIQEVVLAIAHIEDDRKKAIYKHYKEAGYKVKVYDFPVFQTANSKRQMREFDIEELLFRKPIVFHDEKTNTYYKGKIILITGGGGSIGSELCRQLAKMSPQKIIILDVYENGAYEIQQELRIIYGEKLDFSVEILSICNKRSLARVFEKYHPQIVINAAAHKHVPFMENNCIEAVENNVFGTKNLVDLCEEYQVERFMMVSTDKAVNPTNVMGATKRMCEMIVQSASTYGKVKYSATRFGNVLGSAGSVIPLFKKQIMSGGPITLTDKRIIRYFMTIPEASQLVLQSGAMANNGELFVLDMGQPVKILDLAENMIRLSGATGIEIVETGLRPGEKLYEELLVKTEELDKTENSLIFIERDAPYSKEEIEQKLNAIHAACSINDDAVRATLHDVVPTFKRPEEVNAEAHLSLEMQEQRVFN